MFDQDMMILKLISNLAVSMNIFLAMAPRVGSLLAYEFKMATSA